MGGIKLWFHLLFLSCKRYCIACWWPSALIWMPLSKKGWFQLKPEVQTPYKQSVQVKAWFIEGYTYIRDELVTYKGAPSNASVSYHFRHDNFVFIYSSLYQIWLTRNRISQKVYLNGRDEAPKPPVLMNLATILNQKPAFCFLVVVKIPLLLFDAKTYWGIQYTIQ